MSGARWVWRSVVLIIVVLGVSGIFVQGRTFAGHYEEHLHVSPWYLMPGAEEHAGTRCELDGQPAVNGYSVYQRDSEFFYHFWNGDDSAFSEQPGGSVTYEQKRGEWLHCHYSSEV